WMQNFFASAPQSEDLLGRVHTTPHSRFLPRQIQQSPLVVYHQTRSTVETAGCFVAHLTADTRGLTFVRRSRHIAPPHHRGTMKWRDSAAGNTREASSPSGPCRKSRSISRSALLCDIVPISTSSCVPVRQTMTA